MFPNPFLEWESESVNRESTKIVSSIESSNVVLLDVS